MLKALESLKKTTIMFVVSWSLFSLFLVQNYENKINFNLFFYAISQIL